MGLFLEIVKLGSVGVVSGVFGAYLATRRFKHEKWWEMRVNAYKATIKSLADLAAIYETRNRNWESEPIEPKEIRLEIIEHRNKVRKHRDMGVFLLSSEAEKALTRFLNFEIDYESVVDPSCIYGPLSQRSRRCLEEIVALSKKDLAIGQRWL